MKPYAELLEFNQPNPIRKEGFTRIRDSFEGLNHEVTLATERAEQEDGSFLETRVTLADPERIMEFAGRWDYGQNNARKLGETTKLKTMLLRDPETNEGYVYEEVPIIRKYLSMGHESMIEMGWAAFFLEGSRTWSHEIVRHRPVSYQQESQRFVKYEGEDAADLFFLPPELEGADAQAMMDAFKDAKALYDDLRARGVAPQIARYIFPNATRTRLIMATNAREWRHILRLRLDKSAQPEMQTIMRMVYDQLIDIWPNALHGVLDGERGTR